MVLASKLCISLLNLGRGSTEFCRRLVAGYPEEFRYTLFSNCWLVNCEPQGSKRLGYHNMIGEMDTSKSMSENYIEIGKLAYIMKINNKIPRK